MGNQSKTVLLVENEQDISQLITTLLQMKAAYKVITAENGKEALAKLDLIGFALPSEQTQLPDIILTDLNMPVMGGVTFCQTIRESQLYRHIPIIVLSEYASDLAESLKIDYFVPKPFQIGLLIKTIELVLNSATRES